MIGSRASLSVMDPVRQSPSIGLLLLLALLVGLEGSETSAQEPKAGNETTTNLYNKNKNKNNDQSSHSPIIVK